MAVGLRDACRDAYVELRRREGVRGLPDGRLRDSATCDDVGTDHAGDMDRLAHSERNRDLSRHLRTPCRCRCRARRVGPGRRRSPSTTDGIGRELSHGTVFGRDPPAAPRFVQAVVAALSGLMRDGVAAASAHFGDRI